MPKILKKEEKIKLYNFSLPQGGGWGEKVKGFTSLSLCFTHL